MASSTSFRTHLWNVLFWSVVSAAFVGPGTVTTAASAGASYGFSLIWALGFSVFACMLLQEAAVRITMGSGKSLGEVIVQKYGGKATFLRVGLAGAIVLGGLAYQAGNILGALAGLKLVWPQAPTGLVVVLGVLAAALLWWGSHAVVARVLGLLVALMGIVFVYAALNMPLNWGEMLKASFVPRFPSGSSALIVGLIGTTIVPYNLFLASGIQHRQSLSLMRWGLLIAIGLGGLVSVAILLVGSGVEGAFSFEALVAQLTQSIGGLAPWVFGLGLFAAGFTSAVTAPLASAITVEGLFGKGVATPMHQRASYRWVWGITLLVGVLFGVSGIKPIPVILLAQVANGILLPFVAIFVWLVARDASLMPAAFRVRPVFNYLLLGVVGITALLGANKLWKVVESLW